MVSAIPTQYPVLLTDGDHDYPVFNATEFVNAVYKFGHALKLDDDAQSEDVPAVDPAADAAADAE